MTAKRTRGPEEFGNRKVDRAVARACAAISNAIDKMVADLPDGAEPQMAIANLVGELTRQRPVLIQHVIGAHDAREAYEAAIAEIPATPGRTDF
jgi:hypothetical protein